MYRTGRVKVCIQQNHALQTWLISDYKRTTRVRLAFTIEQNFLYTSNNLKNVDNVKKKV